MSRECSCAVARDLHWASVVYPTYARDPELLGGMSEFVVGTGDMLYVSGCAVGRRLRRIAR